MILCCACCILFDPTQKGALLLYRAKKGATPATFTENGGKQSDQLDQLDQVISTYII